MSKMYAREYAASRGYPYNTICKLCREGIIPSLKAGRKFHLDDEEADMALYEHKRREKYTPRQQKIITLENTIKNNKGFNYLERLKALS